MTEFVTVGCRLPHGIEIDAPNGKTFKIKGSASLISQNDGYIMRDYEVTMVPKEIWEFFTTYFKDLSVLKSAALFVIPSEKDKVAIVADATFQPTGLEQLDPASAGDYEVEPADSSEVPKSKRSK
jgi:hypothetical protein